jgi:multicomponent Na+:H+ antiporter subunit B
MSSLIFRTTARYLVPILLLFAAVLLFRGHNHPGGAFPAALVAAVALAIQAMARHGEATTKGIRLGSHVLIGAGFALVLLSGLPGLINQTEFLKASWARVGVGGGLFEWLGTPVLFELGIFAAIVGGARLILESLPEEW